MAEGPHIYNKDGWYYASIAEGGTVQNHQQCLYRSKLPLGPYEEPPPGINPILHNGVGHRNVIHTGHADFIQRHQDGAWFLVFLAIRPLIEREGGLSQLGRETFIAPVEWKDGWPVVNGGKKVDLEVQGLPEKRAETIWMDQFDKGEQSPAVDVDIGRQAGTGVVPSSHATHY